MNKFDFVILYEIKNRELENILLLKYELNRRGYTVGLIETWDHIVNKKKPVKADVLISFALYRSGTVNYVSSFVSGCKKIVNLQWEQIYTNGDAKRIETDDDFFYGIRENAVNGAHISWGNVNYDRLVRVFKVSPSKVCLAGNISMDFLRPELQGYYYSKDQIFSKYSLNPNRKLYLFISSFSYVDLPSNYKNSKLYQGSGFDINSFYHISSESQVMILQWFEKELVEHKDIEVIYRPHPAEYGNNRLADMSKKYSNFHVISDMSIKQWIVIADKIYTWWSTSVGEVYAAGKGCSVLRPLNIPYDSEIETYKDCEFITSFEAFRDQYLEIPEFPISRDVMESYYHIDPEKPSYKLIADFIEKVYGSDEFVMNIEEKKEASSFDIWKSNVKSGIMRIVIDNKFFSCLLVNVSKLLGQKKKEYIESKIEEMKYAYKMTEKNSYNHAEADAITNRIISTLEGANKISE